MLEIDDKNAQKIYTFEDVTRWLLDSCKLYFYFTF